MQKILSAKLTIFLLAYSWFGSASALSPYRPQLEVIMLDNEPCFYAQKKADVDAEGFSVRSAFYNFNRTRIQQHQEHSMLLSSYPQECLKFSELFPVEDVPQPRFNTKYTIEIVLESPPKEYAKQYPKDGYLPLPPLPKMKSFSVHFSLEKDSSGAIQVKKGP
jgi:hypothetical protein